MVVVEAGFVIILALGVIAFVVAQIADPKRKQAKIELIEIEKQSRVDRNHQDMFLFINELSALDEYQPIFNRRETAEKAKQLMNTYREETTK